MPAYYLEALTISLGVILLMADAFVTTPTKSWLGYLAAIGLAAILVASFFATGPCSSNASWPLWNFYQFDSLARFYKIFALLTTLFVCFLTIDYRKVLSRFTEGGNSEVGTGEYYALPVFACSGMMLLASAKDLAGAFVALELVTITFYILVAYMRRNVGSLEAGVKYLILGALSTGFLVYGIAWIYGVSGTMSLDALSHCQFSPQQTTPLLFGLALVIVGLGFKVGAVPMHIWIPDVYQGAPTPTTAFLSVGSKAAGFILLIRTLEPFLQHSSLRGPILCLLTILAIATLLFGNLAAIPQQNFKRLLAYSSIAHAGFMVLALATGASSSANSQSATEVVSFYLATYLIMTLGAFFILSQVRIHRDGESLSHFNGLGKTNPTLALALTILMAALAGVPLTAGFWGKFMVFSLVVNAKLYTALAVAIIAATAGFFYYFKVIRSIWWVNPDENATPITVPCLTKCCVAILVLATIVFGIAPEPILHLLH